MASGFMILLCFLLAKKPSKTRGAVCYAVAMQHTRHEQYWQRFLVPGEKAVHTFGVSGIYVAVFWGLPFLAVLLLMIASSLTSGLLVVLFFILALVFLIAMLYLLFFVHYVITDRRVMGREGIFHKRFVTVDFRSITDIAVTEPFLERLLTRTGTIAINTAGGPSVELWYRHVRHPFALRQDIYQHLQRAVVKDGRQAGMKPAAGSS
jgi:uncharacterized membrane protein YdbT with pleckstrin-like domain